MTEREALQQSEIPTLAEILNKDLRKALGPLPTLAEVVNESEPKREKEDRDDRK